MNGCTHEELFSAAISIVEEERSARVSSFCERRRRGGRDSGGLGDDGGDGGGIKGGSIGSSDG